MLSTTDFEQLAEVLHRNPDRNLVQKIVQDIRRRLNSHPADQQFLNVPFFENKPLEGVQHKYLETVLFFPSQGQVCHSYCSFCFRWAQFIGDKELRFSANEAVQLTKYLKIHKGVSDLLITGGDPMVMKASHLTVYFKLLLDPDLAHIQTIRIGTKSLTFWPHRFVHDEDADELLKLLSNIVKAGKHVAIMAHYGHWREMMTPIARKAIQRLRDTGVVIRAQAPLLNHINNDADVRAQMWREQVHLGMTALLYVC